ncbi:hypothetical protein [Lentzea cavernae]|uniref:Uncharacterized protein n=1 Tax=Lentzea cavernae TaxID=2020703 RepID=A0ABQ3MKP1_9PSEU|nr:hypothetical protein [Lentzea cavernae]GHH48352.1 hypothetical protein GCM10017774_54240 [Lentzea cavernae]
MAARGETQANVEVSTLVVPAWMLRWRAPELALVLGERAVALASARRDEADRLRAESLVVFAGNRVGRGVRFADRAIDALKAAEVAGEHETGWLLRVELAACARSVGAPLTGFAAVTPVLEAPDVPAELRASALVQASECLVTVGRGDEPTRALAEADQLYVADTTLDEDTRLLLRGQIRAVQAAQHRRWGDIAAAIGAAREGLDLLSRFSDPDADSGQGLGRLTLELALALMDANRLLDASAVGAPLLDRPVRAPSASATGWLRLALATRVHLPAGRVGLAREMLREAVASAERHQLDTLLAESLLALADVHEVSGDLADALTNLRSAHAAERRRARAVYAVRARLAAEFSGVHRQPADLHQQLASVLRPVEGMQVVTDGVLSAALKQQLRQWRPVQVRKGDGPMVKRARRAAEDMTVEGLSAARQHAADRWRMVQPFGEPDDKTPEAVEPPPAPLPSSSPSPSDRTVPASGLIASAGAMVSGRRRAARVAAGEIDDDRPTTIAEIPITPAAPEPPPQEPEQQPQLTVEQERKRKVEQQLMELQREARRQIEAERQARAEQRAQAEREAQAAEEAARQEAARQEAARQEAARQEEAARHEAARQEAAREEAARQEAARQEAAREEAARQEAARQEAAREEAARQEAARQEAAREEAARQEAARQEAAREEAARQEAARVEAARQEAARLDAARQEAARLDAVRQEEIRREAARQEAVRRDVARQEAAHQEVARLAVEREEAARAEAAARDDESNSQPESVLDMLKAQGLRAGGRRRARDAEQQSDTPSWRVEPPSGPRQNGQAEDASPNYFADSSTRSRAERLADQNNADGGTRSGLAAAFSRPPAAPDFGPHVDEPAYPLHTPAGGFPASEADPDERKLPDLDFSSLDFSTPKPKPAASIPTPAPEELPDPEPGRQPLAPVPDPVPAVPVPDEIPPAPEPDLLSTSFLSSADVDDDPSDVPTTPVRAQPRTEQAFGGQSSFGAQSSFGTQSGFGSQSFGSTPTFGTQPDFGAQPVYSLESTYGTGSGGNTDSGYGTDFGHGSEAGRSADRTGPGSDPATSVETGSGADAQSDSVAPYDFFATKPEGGEPANGTGPESDDRTGRPSSRRRPSEMSLADLLAEALVAYETGRRSDEEQLDASDLTAPDWSAVDTGGQAATADLPDRPAEAEPPEDSAFRPGEHDTGADFRPGEHDMAADFRSGESFGTATDVRPGESFGTATDLRPGESFGTATDFRSGEPFGAPTDFRTDESFGAAAEVRTGSDPGAGTAFSSESLFRTSRSQDESEDGPSAETLFGSGASYIVQLNRPAGVTPSSEAALGSGAAFGGQDPAAQSPFSSEALFGANRFGPQQGASGENPDPLFRPSAFPQESEQEKTGPIIPVAPDTETTGPIRPFRGDGPPGWTLPGR